MTIRVLITGVSGFLGWHLFHYLSPRFSVTGTYSRHRPRLAGSAVEQLDLRDPAAAGKIFSRLSPEVVIHCAAVTSPAACLIDPGLTREVNIAGTESIAHAAQIAGTRMIYISTDRVFDGKQGNYRENAPARPLGPYGQSKLDGEKLVRKIVPEHLVLRLPLMYGSASPFSGSFLEFMRKGFLGQTPLDLFLDQYRTPLYVADAARGIELILKRPKLQGLYHLGGSERINRVDFGCRMAKIFNYNPAVINPVRMADLPHYPPTPPDASLNSDLFFQATGFRGRGVIEGLTELRKKIGVEG